MVIDVHGVTLSRNQPPVLGFDGSSFWRYTEIFHDLELRLRQILGRDRGRL
jgi:hypothetical protein